MSRQLGKPKKPVPYGAAQHNFIAKTRQSVKALGRSFFDTNNWTNIVPPFSLHTCLTSPDLSLYAESLYVRPIAMWIPHLLVPDHCPSCPRCEKNDGVDLTQLGQFVETPKLLYGVGSHRYLDTVYYSCRFCERKFAGYNERSMELDASRVIGIFNFHLSRGGAIDDDLYNFIVNHRQDTTSSIYHRLALLASDKYVDTAMFYYRAVHDKKVRMSKSGTVSESSQQRTLDGIVTRRKPESKTEQQLRLKRDQYEKAQRDLKSKTEQYNGDVSFSWLLSQKTNRNKIKQMFPGIGVGKMEFLLHHAKISTAKELLDYDGTHPGVKNSWRRTVSEYYDRLRTVMVAQQKYVEQVSLELDTLEVCVQIEEEEAENATFGDATSEVAVVTIEQPQLPPKFSEMMDKEKYNARCLSKGMIDRVIVTDHSQRSTLQDAKMRNIPASVLKMDWSYKVPPKVKVYTGPGRCFSPFKCMLTIQNEDSCDIFWKMYSGSESYGRDGAREDLLRLKARLDHLGCTVKVIYVDNCCTVRAILQEIFPDAEIKLDVYHWFARWDEAMADVRSPEASVFRHLMRRAMYIVENSEFTRVQYLLRSKLNRQPTTKK